MKNPFRRSKDKPTIADRALELLDAKHADLDERITIQAFRDSMCCSASILLANLPSASECIRRRSPGASETDVREKIIGCLAPLFDADPSAVLADWSNVQPESKAN